MNRRRLELAQRLAAQTPDFTSWHAPEPMLVFGGGKTAAEPKVGIRLHGPCGNTDDKPLSSIRIALVGTGGAVDAAQQWLERLRGTVVAEPDRDSDPGLFPVFPGLDAADGFRCEVEAPDSLVEILTPAETVACTSARRDEAVEHAARLVGERLDVLRDRDAPPDVVIVALSDEIRRVAGGGRNPSRRTPPTRPRKPSQQMNLFDDRKPELPASPSRTLHRAVKAEGMRYGLPTQMAWPSTFSGEGGQDAGTRAWNFATALYYKAGGVPWRGTGLSRDTLYIGLSFFRTLGSPHLLQTSMAQTFSDRGEGVVLRGASFDWDIKRHGAPQLPTDAARALIASAIEQFERHHRKRPTRIVVHKTSRFGTGELAGMEEALAGVPFADFLSLARSDIRFLRVGQEPPIRGTCVEIDPRRYVVYTRGYVPYLKLYPGLRIPRPIQVRHERGTTPIRGLLSEVLALTRLNWNSADFAAADPITIGFAERVGLILSELPAGIEPARSFRFYM